MADNLTDLKMGKVVKLNGDPYLIVWSEFNRKQQRKPVMKTKLKNVKNGAALDKTFLAGESFEFADIQRKKCQYLYKTDEEAYFMNEETYEQFEIPLDFIEGSLPFLIDGTTIDGVFYEGKVISVELPPKMVFEVIQTMPGVKGDTASGGSKPATLETGLVVKVPLFINEGDKVRVNTESAEYVERA
ncbi:elongation factor P [bacterium]|nr:elongation factor P [bacterium]